MTALSEWISSPTESLMHGITHPLLSVLLDYPLSVGHLGALILDFFSNIIVVKQLLTFIFEPCCLAHTALHTVLLYLSFWANKCYVIWLNATSRMKLVRKVVGRVISACSLVCLSRLLLTASVPSALRLVAFINTNVQIWADVGGK